MRKIWDEIVFAAALGYMIAVVWVLAAWMI